VDPLVVAGQLREGVDVLLGDRPPLGRADRLALEPLQLLDPVDLDRRRHRREQYPGACVHEDPEVDFRLEGI